MRLLSLGLAAATLAVPALGQDEVPGVTLFAAFAGGFADGVVIDAPPVGRARVHQLGPGSFLLAGESKSKALLTVREPEPCRFELLTKMNPPQAGTATADLRRMGPVTFEPRAATGDVPGWRIVVAVGEGDVTFPDGNGGTASFNDMTSVVYSTIDRAAMEAAAEQMRTRCVVADVADVALAPDTGDGGIDPAVDLVAAIVTGLADGAHIALGPEGIAVRTGPGRFDIEGTDGTPGPSVSVTEVSSCIFELSLTLPGAAPEAVQFNANLIRSYTFTPEAAPFGLNGFVVGLDGEDGILNRVTTDGLVPATDSQGNIVTSLARDDLEAAAALLRASYCPGPAV